MMKMNKNKKGQAGFVITVELLMIVVILVMGLVSGWGKVRDMTVAELGDTGDAVGAIDQSYILRGTTWLVATGPVAAHSGFQFDDATDPAGAGVGGDGVIIQYGAALTPSVSGTAASFEANTY